MNDTPDADRQTEVILFHLDGTVRVKTLETPEMREAITKVRTDTMPVGTRVRLMELAQTPEGYDDRPNLPPGSYGTVTGEPDSAGSLPIKWDHGSTLAATIEDVIVPIE